MNSFLSELCAWLDRDRLGKKVLLCRSVETGNQLLRMAAAHGTPAVNAQAASVQGYMIQLAEPVLMARQLQRIDHITASIALQKIMGTVGDAFTTLGKVELTTAESVLPQLNELERNQVTPDQLEVVGEPLLATVWREYMDWKQNNGYASDLQTLEAAEVPEHVSFALLSNLQLSQVEQQFIRRIPSERLTIIHVLTPKGDPVPRNAVNQSPEPCAHDAPIPRCVDCQDIGTEIRWALQHLVEATISAEDVVIVCPDDAYGLRVEEEGKLIGITVDSAFGMPATMTKTALLIRCILDWAGKNYDVEALRPALVSGAMALYNDSHERVMLGQEMLRIFRRRNVGWGAERWAQLAKSEKDRYALVGRLMDAWVQFFEAEDRPVREIAQQLTDLLNRCMLRGIENDFYLNIVDEVSRIYGGTMDAYQYLSIVEAIASTHKIASQTTETPGHVYCCRYEDALYVNRSHFIMLGMSWDAFNKLSREFPLLHDVEKQVLSPSLRLVADGALERRYAVRELLANREDACVVFSRARMDHVGGEDIMAASIYDDAAKQYPEAKVPQINILDRAPLTELDVHIRSGFDIVDDELLIDDGQEEKWKQAFDECIWSATLLETAYDCPRKYTLSEQMGVTEEQPQPLEQYAQSWLGAADRGSIIHEVLEQYFSQTAPRVDTADEQLLRRLVQDSVAKYKLRIPIPSNLKGIEAEVDSIIDVVIEEANAHANDSSRRTMGTEISFGGEEPLDLTFGPYTIHMKGRIDRVDQVEDGYEIIDYKSGRPRRFRRDFDIKLQYYLYTLAWEKLHPDQPIRRATYDLVDGIGGIEKKTVEMTDAVREDMNQKVTELLDLLADPVSAVITRQEMWGDDFTCPDYCPFIAICDRIGFPKQEEPGEFDSAPEENDFE